MARTARCCSRPRVRGLAGPGPQTQCGDPSTYPHTAFSDPDRSSGEGALLTTWEVSQGTGFTHKQQGKHSEHCQAGPGTVPSSGQAFPWPGKAWSACVPLAPVIPSEARPGQGRGVGGVSWTKVEAGPPQCPRSFQTSQ